MTETPNPEATDFGYRKVGDASQKTRLVRDVFDRVAERYDLMNDLMSGGLHRAWKRSFLAQARLAPGERALDVAGGTGDIAFGLLRGAAGTHVTVCDLNEDMVRVGRRRGWDRGIAAARLGWTVGDAAQLPFPDASVDVVTIAFGLRNVTRIDDALAEFARVLRPGGRFYCLEFSQVEDPLMGRLYDAYSFTVIPLLGRLVAQDRESYQYLAESIRRFPSRPELARRMGEAGFEGVQVRTMTRGVVAVHSGQKPATSADWA